MSLNLGDQTHAKAVTTGRLQTRLVGPSATLAKPGTGAVAAGGARRGPGRGGWPGWHTPCRQVVAGSAGHPLLV